MNSENCSSSAFSDSTNRRSLARQHLKPNEVPLTVTSFPRLGVSGQFTEPYFDPSNAISSHSLFLPQEITNPHARFPSVLQLHLVFFFIIYSIYHCRTLTANIRSRRGSKVAINLPLFIDSETPRPFIDPSIPWDRSLYPEDPRNWSAFSLYILCSSVRVIRGQEWCSTSGPYIPRCHGLWNGLLLPPVNVSGL